MGTGVVFLTTINPVLGVAFMVIGASWFIIGVKKSKIDKQ